MNTSIRNRIVRNARKAVNPNGIEYQSAISTDVEVTDVEVEDDEDEEESTPEGKKKESKVLEDNEFGSIVESYFRIKIESKTEKVLNAKGKEVPKVIYENKFEPFKHQTVDTLIGGLKYLGAKGFTDDMVKALGTALVVKGDDAESKANNEAIGKSVASVIKTLNAKFKADAKSSAYQALTNKHTPLEGQQRETAIARIVANMVKVTPGLAPEDVIEFLKLKGSVPATYTLQDYLDTPLRRTNDEE